MVVDAPGECCLNPARRQVERDYGSGVLARCNSCDSLYISAELHIEEYCVDPMHLRLWKRVEQPPGSLMDAAEYVMSNKPYYARNVRAGGDFQRVD